MPKAGTVALVAAQPAEKRATLGAGLKDLEEQIWGHTIAATYWFHPPETGETYAASVRIFGRRVNAEAKPQRGDRFECLESVPRMVPGSGPVSVTTRLIHVNRGEWLVWAQPLRRDHEAKSESARSDPTSLGAPIATRTPWSRGNTVTTTPIKVRTQVAAFASVPGVIPAVWSALVTLGVVVGIVMQALLIDRAHIEVATALAISLTSSAAGLVGARLWFLALRRSEAGQIFCRGLCIQGFIAAAVIVGTIGVALGHIPAAQFADFTSPGLFVGMAIGRLGCFFTGCCTGRPTASRWGVWASDGRVGMRRIPTQLTEAVVSLVIGVAALILVLRLGTAAMGAVFVGGLAAYTLSRQLLLPLRAEPRKSTIGAPLTMMAAALVLLGDIVYMIGAVPIR